MPRVVWVEESKTGLEIEIGPSYDDVPTTSQCATAWQSSCILVCFTYPGVIIYHLLHTLEIKDNLDTIVGPAASRVVYIFMVPVKNSSLELRRYLNFVFACDNLHIIYFS